MKNRKCESCGGQSPKKTLPPIPLPPRTRDAGEGSLIGKTPPTVEATYTPNGSRKVVREAGVGGLEIAAIAFIMIALAAANAASDERKSEPQEKPIQQTQPQHQSPKD